MIARFVPNFVIRIRRPLITEKGPSYRINREIRAEKVRLLSEEGGQNVLTLSDALAMAASMGLDLVEISPNQEPPVVKITDYSKFKFEQIKKAKEAKKKQKIIHLKEIKFRPNIDSHDFDHKIKSSRTFLEKGDKVKFTLMFRGREMMHSQLGFEVMKRIQEALEEIAVADKAPQQEGRNITMIVSLKPGGARKITT